jgi:hypothetical protein
LQGNFTQLFRQRCFQAARAGTKIRIWMRH